MLRLFVVVTLAMFASACGCGKGPALKTDSPVLDLPMQTLDFGPVPEGQMKDLTATVANMGRAPMNLNAMVAADGATDFSLGPIPASVPAQGQVMITVHYIPVGAGSDSADMVVTTNDPDHPTGTIKLLGGPISPALQFEPDPVTFNGATVNTLFSQQVMLHSVGTSNLHVTAIGVAPTGNPAFSINGPALAALNLPAALPPDASVEVQVDYYAQNVDGGPGYMQVDSDDPAGLKSVELLPTGFAQCADGIDNDGDGLIDYPDDPGCSDLNDNDEYNPPECVNGAIQPCGMSVGVCTAGLRTCSNSVWSTCDGGVRPSMEICDGLDNDCNGVSDDHITETCGMNACAGVKACVPDSGIAGGEWGACAPLMNPPPEICDGIDNNCNGQIDEGISRACVAMNGCAGVQNCVPGGTGVWTSCAQNDPLCGSDAGMIDGGCVPNGLFTIDGGAIAYSCTYGIVDFSITQIQVQTNGAKVTCGPMFGANNLTGTSNAVCPGGTFTATNTLYGQAPDNCDETYTVTATYTDPNTIVGTFTASYSGPACTGLGDDCINHSWNFSAGR